MLYATGLYALNIHLPNDETIGDWHPQHLNQPPETRDTDTSVLGTWHIFPLSNPIQDAHGNTICHIADHRRAAMDLIEDGQKISDIKRDCLDSEAATRDMMHAASRLYTANPSQKLDENLTYHYRADWLLAKKTTPIPKQRTKPMKKDKTTLMKITSAINKNNNAPVLKGGNAIVLLYDEPRWSSDLDFDQARGWKQKEQIKKTIAELCSEQNWEFRLAKDTDTVTRFLIRESPTDNKPLKLEISHRYGEPNNTITVKNIRTYDVPTLIQQKTSAYLNRDRVRDLQDIAYLFNKFPNQISTETLDVWHDANERKPFDEQFDYLWLSQPMELTSQEWSELARNVLDMQETVQKIEDDIEHEMLDVQQSVRKTQTQRENTL